MSWTAFLLYCFAAIGLTNIIVHGKVMDEIRLFGKSLRGWLHSWYFTKELSNCYECSGFWSGLICGAFFLYHMWWLIPMAGFAGSMLGKTYADLMFYLESKVEFEVSNGQETGD